MKNSLNFFLVLAVCSSFNIVSQFSTISSNAYAEIESKNVDTQHKSLNLQDIIDSLDNNHPLLKATEQEINSSEADILSAKGSI